MFTHYPLTTEEQLAAASGWEELAETELERLQWDKTALPEMVRNKAALYRQVAADIRAKAVIR